MYTGWFKISIEATKEIEILVKKMVLSDLQIRFSLESLLHALTSEPLNPVKEAGKQWDGHVTRISFVIGGIGGVTSLTVLPLFSVSLAWVIIPLKCLNFPIENFVRVNNELAPGGSSLIYNYLENY